jgi:uncharacterized MAPEG superfamily protein
MSTIIIATLALALFQFWLLPASTKAKDIMWLLGTRDDAKDPTVIQARIIRAADNLKESLPAFLALALLSMIQQVELTQVAMIWLGLRVAYVPCYVIGINPVRSIVWLASLACLIYMAWRLV